MPVVAVPARNEEFRLSRLIEALGHQNIGEGERLRVVIVLNNTTDRSREVLGETVPLFPLLDVEVIDVDFAPDAAHVGSARKLGMDRAAEIIGNDPGVILTTDADGTPHPDWVSANVAAIMAGADLVGGRIFGDPLEEAALGQGFRHRAATIAAYARASDQLLSLIDPLPHDPWPRHQDHTGASLAIRADVYRAVGGLPPLPFREDLGLVEKVLLEGFKLVHPESVAVTVSARLKGRAPGGMADCIAGWLEAEARQEPILVEDPLLIEARAERRRQIRALLGRPRADWAAALASLGADKAEAETLDLNRRDVAHLLGRFAANAPDAPLTIPVELAMASLEARIAELEQALHAA
jgi:hypothetical protein